jgi:hypothetical protein
MSRSLTSALLRRRRVQNDLGPILCPGVEVLVRVRALLQREFVGDDERRRGLTFLDQIGQVAVVGLDRALTGAEPCLGTARARPALPAGRRTGHL